MPRSAAGLSMVELMVVVTILSFLMMLALPSYQRIQRKTRASAVINDFRVFTAVFQAYAHETGNWPPEAAAGVVPTGITSQDLQTDVWTHATPIGGKFDWEFMQVHPGGTSPGGTWRAAITITGTADAPLLLDLDLFQQMDAALDDGNLATGNFRLGFGGGPILIIEP
jgi:type II secretory pathway pseudopilin PulG